MGSPKKCERSEQFFGAKLRRTRLCRVHAAMPGRGSRSHAGFFLFAVEDFCFDALVIIAEAFPEDIDSSDMTGGFRNGDFDGDFRPVI